MDAIVVAERAGGSECPREGGIRPRNIIDQQVLVLVRESRSEHPEADLTSNGQGFNDTTEGRRGGLMIMSGQRMSVILG